MAKAALVLKHVSMTLAPNEVYDLIVTLHAAKREFGDSVPESIDGTLGALLGAYDGDLPGDEFNVEQAADDDGDTAAA